MTVLAEREWVAEWVDTEWGRMPRPKFATPRNHDLPTTGHLDAKFADVWLGAPPMPWQRMVGDVAGEYDPATGLPVYTMIVGVLQRQVGKSHMTVARKARKCFMRRNTRAWYTAQTGGDAQDQFLKFNDDVVAESPLARVVQTLRGNGHAVMRFPNKSTIRPHPPTEKALHGKQSDDNDVDEAWAHSEDEGKAIMQAIAPTQLTRPGAQTFIWSAGGTAESTWLAGLVALGRALCSSDDPAAIIAACREAGIAYFEFGIPDDEDFPLDDLELVASYNPAYGHTLTLEGLKSLRTQLTDDAEFARAAGNRWTEVIGGVIPDKLWKRVQVETEIPDDVPLGFGAARSEDGTQVAIVSAAEVGGQIVVEVCDILPSAWRAAEHVEEWAAGDALAVDRAGASTTLHDEIVTRGVHQTPTERGERIDLVDGPMPITSRDVSGACQYLLDAMNAKDGDGQPAPGVVFRPSPALDAAVKIAGKRKLDNGGWVWAHTAAGQIAVLQAATLAVYALRHRVEPPEETPAVFSS